ncbi:MAG: LytTR family DNA-binding domain-containing protein [Bacteroidia bacterium]|nr:LytTR family DNA-binding domain-containing protein [Bacteroidia bacterium]
MNILIIEDETPAAEKLERYLLKHDPKIEIKACITSISESVNYLREKQEELDLIFMDIQLSDGLSFEIFSQLQIRTPVIFTTAFDEYAIDAFKVNGVDYLLKPIRFTDLSNSLKKLDLLREQLIGNREVKQLSQGFKKKSYKERFMVKIGAHINTIAVQDVLFFRADGRTAYLYTKEGKRYIIDYKLEDLMEILNPGNFYRVNRSFIIQIHAIQDVLVYSNSRLKIIPPIKLDKEIIVSREKVTDFKTWLKGN